MGSMHSIGTAHLRPLGGADEAPGVRTEHLDDPTGHGLKTVLARRPFLPLELSGQPVAPGVGMVEGLYGGLDTML
jgi:hypothetical protein